MPKKGKDCESCTRYDCTDTRCVDCRQNLFDPVYTNTHGLVFCKCLTVAHGEDCPYYERRV